MQEDFHRPTFKLADTPPTHPKRTNDNVLRRGFDISTAIQALANNGVVHAQVALLIDMMSIPQPPAYELWILSKEANAQNPKLPRQKFISNPNSP